MVQEIKKLLDEILECGVIKKDGKLLLIDNMDIAKLLSEREVVILPCMIKSKVFGIINPCDSCDLEEAMRSKMPAENLIELCQRCDKFEIIEMEFSYEDVDSYGKWVFPTREAATEKLERLKKERMKKNE